MSAKVEKTEIAGKSGANKSIIMIVGVVVLVVVLIVGKVFLGGAKAADKNKKAEQEVGISFPLEEFMVNLSGGGDHYLRTNIALGLKKGLTEEQMKEHTSALRDTVLTVLSDKTLKDLATSKSRENLKSIVKDKINKELGEDDVVKVYFTTFATQ